MTMETKRLGKTDLEVGRLGIGLSEIGSNLEMTDTDQVRSVIFQALDAGVNFLDTAACYGISEEILGVVASESMLRRRIMYPMSVKRNSRSREVGCKPVVFNRNWWGRRDSNPHAC